MSSKHILYCYGTIRPGTGPTVLIPGVMYDLGWFPGVKVNWDAVELLKSGFGLPAEAPKFVAERIEVDDERLKQLDSYEGYYPDDPNGSLYIRKPYLDGHIYEYNQQLSESHQVVTSGDWLKHTNSSRGRAA